MSPEPEGYTGRSYGQDYTCIDCGCRVDADRIETHNGVCPGRVPTRE